MGAATSLIPELEQVIQHGSRQKRVETLRRITALFLAGAGDFAGDHVELFDGVFALLIEVIETKARAELATQLAPVENAPTRTIKRLAGDDDIEVAGPVLQLAPRLADEDLVDLARTKSQAHLQAIATRKVLAETVTEVLVRRGDREVARSVAENPGARFSEPSFARLVDRAEHDGILAEKVGLRSDIPPRLFHELLTRATSVVHKRLMASAAPELREEIRRVLQKVSTEVSSRVGPRDYRAAQRVVLALHRAGGVTEAALADFAAEGRYDETVVALAALGKVPLNVADRLMANERPDPVLILCRAIGLGWTTVKAVICVCPDGVLTSRPGLEAAFANYGQLSVSTAQRVVRYWQLRREKAAVPSDAPKDEETGIALLP